MCNSESSCAQNQPLSDGHSCDIQPPDDANPRRSRYDGECDCTRKYTGYGRAGTAAGGIGASGVFTIEVALVGSKIRYASSLCDHVYNLSQQRVAADAFGAHHEASSSGMPFTDMGSSVMPHLGQLPG
jgi:hypothetical protein